MRSRQRTERDNITLFFHSDDVLSQWYRTKFQVDGIHYNCAEQYMMHQKAGESSYSIVMLLGCCFKSTFFRFTLLKIRNLNIRIVLVKLMRFEVCQLVLEATQPTEDAL